MSVSMALKKFILAFKINLTFEVKDDSWKKLCIWLKSKIGKEFCLDNLIGLRIVGVDLGGQKVTFCKSNLFEQIE